MKLIMYDDGLSYRWLETCGGVLSYRGLHETGAIQFSQMLLKHVMSNVLQKLSDGRKSCGVSVCRLPLCQQCSQNRRLSINYMYGYIKSLYLLKEN